MHGRATSKNATVDLDGTASSTVSLVEFVARQLLARFLRDRQQDAKAADQRLIQALQDDGDAKVAAGQSVPESGE